MAREGSGDTVRLEYHLRERPDDLIAATAVALLLCLTVIVIPDSPLRTVLGLVFILFLPGYVSTAALFPERERIDLIERIALSLGLSIAIVPIIGLALNYTPFGIRLEPIIAILTVFVIAVSFIAWRRRISLPEDERFRLDLVIDLGVKGMPMIDRILTIGIAITLAATLILLAYVIAVPKSGESFTQLALLGPDMMADDYPRNLTVYENAMVIVTVKSFETTAINYTILISLQTDEDSNITDWNYTNPFDVLVELRQGVAHLQNFSLQPGDEINWTFDFSVIETGEFKLRFMLFKDEQGLSGEPYREVYLWLFVT